MSELSDGEMVYLACSIDHACAAVPERYLVLRWLLDEWDLYSNTKFGFTENHKVDDHDESMRRDGYAHTAWWPRQIFQYLDRAATFGVGQARSEMELSIADINLLAFKGRQAAMKMSTTLLDSLACMIRVHGLPPAPGHTSGEIVPWDPTTLDAGGQADPTGSATGDAPETYPASGLGELWLVDSEGHSWYEVPTEQEHEDHRWRCHVHEGMCFRSQFTMS